VVAIGNLTVGGTGKTPLVELLARWLNARGWRVAVLSRGYGRRDRGVRVVLGDERAGPLESEVAGDEPVLLARRLREVPGGVPVVVGRDRMRAGALARERCDAALLLLDDGFQQRHLRADVAIVCLDARRPWGPGGLLPQGSLREPPAAVGRAHLLVLTHAVPGPGLTRLRAELSRLAPGVPVALARYEPEAVTEPSRHAVHPPGHLAGRRLLAFAGIAEPDGFRATLEDLGVRVAALVPFPDHYRYEARDVRELERRARAMGAEALITTEKDGVRWPGGGDLAVWMLAVRLRLDEEGDAWWATLEARLGAHPTAPAEPR
jgi:tetraacyldisaccharide 4'-kinase